MKSNLFFWSESWKLIDCHCLVSRQATSLHCPKKDIWLRRWCGVVFCLFWFVLSASMVRSLLNAMSNSDISASEKMLKNLEGPQRRALRMTMDLERSKKEQKTVSVSICWACTEKTLLKLHTDKWFVCLSLQEEKQLTRDFPYQAKKSVFFSTWCYLKWKLGLWRNNWGETQRIKGQGCIAVWTAGSGQLMQVTDQVQQDTQGLPQCCNTEGRTPVPNTWTPV